MKLKLQLFVFTILFLIASMPLLEHEFENEEIEIKLNYYVCITVYSTALNSLVQSDSFSALVGKIVVKYFTIKKGY